MFTAGLFRLIGAIVPLIILAYGYKFAYVTMTSLMSSNLITFVPPYPLVWVLGAFLALLGAVVGLIGVAGFEVVKIALFNIDLFKETGRLLDLIYLKGLILFLIVFFLIRKLKKHPIIYIVFGAIIGILFKF